MSRNIIRAGFSRFRSKVRVARSRLAGAPLWPEKATLAIEVSGFCNLRCPMCYYPHLKRPKGFMEWDLFEKIVDDMANNGHDINSLHFFGEPLLWPHIMEGVALLTRNNLFPKNISTNGMLFTGELARQLQAAGLKEIMVTIDTLVPEGYSRIRTGGDLDVVKQNIHDALDAAPNLLVRAQFMPTKYNLDETGEDFCREFGRRPNFKVQPWFVIRWDSSENVSRDWSHRPDEVDKRLCDRLFDRVIVLWDGTTVLCCMDVEGELVTGNLKENSIAYSLLGPKAMAFRNKILRGEWMELNACRRCPADHILMATKDDRWRLTNPPVPLPPEQRRLLEEIEKLETFDEKTGTWTKDKRWFGF